MKTNIILVTLLSFFIPVLAKAQSTTTVKVWGNCGMCKKTIETAAKKGGALTADWNKDTKMLTFTTSGQSGNTEVQKAIAAAGYDTQDFNGNNAAYEKLPGCCHYERKAVKAGKATARHESCGKEGCTDCKDHASKMDCCKDGKCEGKTACTDKAACKEKGCEGKDCCKS